MGYQLSNTFMENEALIFWGYATLFAFIEGHVAVFFSAIFSSH